MDIRIPENFKALNMTKVYSVQFKNILYHGYQFKVFCQKENYSQINKRSKQYKVPKNVGSKRNLGYRNFETENFLVRMHHIIIIYFNVKQPLLGFLMTRMK